MLVAWHSPADRACLPAQVDCLYSPRAAPAGRQRPGPCSRRARHHSRDGPRPRAKPARRATPARGAADGAVRTTLQPLGAPPSCAREGRALRPTPVQGLLQDLRPTAVRGDPSSSQARNCVELEPRPLPRDGAGQILFGPRPSEALPKAAAVAQCPAPGLCSKEHAPSGATKARPRAETAWRDQPERPAYGLASGTRAHARNGVSPVPTSPCGAPLC